MGLMELFKNAPATLFDEYNTEVILTPLMGESFSGTATVTENAVEDGSIITDHVHSKPDSFSLRMMLVDKNDLAAAAVATLFGGDKSVEEKIQTLQIWKEFGDLLTYRGPIFSGLLTKGYDFYGEDLVITGLNVSRDADTGAALSVDITLQSIVIAQAMISEINLPQAARSRSSRGATARGSASASTTSTSGRSSILSRLTR